MVFLFKAPSRVSRFAFEDPNRLFDLLRPEPFRAYLVYEDLVKDLNPNGFELKQGVKETLNTRLSSCLPAEHLVNAWYYIGVNRLLIDVDSSFNGL